jgi:formylmethanofuran dehydrogenase subunit E
MNTKKVTRFEVIDHRNSPDVKGRIVVENDVNVELSMQDDDRTLKVFLTDREKGVPLKCSSCGREVYPPHNVHNGILLCDGCGQIGIA